MNAQQQFYLIRDVFGKSSGPYNMGQLIRMQAEGQIEDVTGVCPACDGGEWVSWASLHEEAQAYLAQHPPKAIPVRKVALSFNVLTEDGIIGPHSLADLMNYEQLGRIHLYSSVRRAEGEEGWKAWWQVKEELAAQTPLPVGDAKRARPVRYAVKASSFADARRYDEPDRDLGPELNRGVYILLALFLGTMGIHNFYCGHSLAGLLQLGATLLGLLLFFAGVGLGVLVFCLVGVWVLFDIVTQTRDGHGRPMT